MEINVYKQPINERSWVWNRLNSMEMIIPFLIMKIITTFEIDLIVWKWSRQLRRIWVKWGLK